MHGWKKPVRRQLLNKTEKMLTRGGAPWSPRIDGKQPKPRATTYPHGLALAQDIRQGGESLKKRAYDAGRLRWKTLRERFIAYFRDRINEAD